MNQCDGCRRKLPIRDGMHYDSEIGMVYMACVKEKYERGSDMLNPKECPECKKLDARYSAIIPQMRCDEGAIYVAAYCPDCGYSWYAIYTLNETKDRR